MTNSFPTLALVENMQARISHSLMTGAVDSIMSSESNDSMIEKAKILFGQSENFSGNTKTNLNKQTIQQQTQVLKVFVIEDDMLLRNLLDTKFTLSDIQPEFSADGLGVNDMIRAFKPHVIIFDITIGAINGLDLLEQLKAEEDLASIPAIIFSNQDSDQERERATELGAHDYLVKVSTDLGDLVKIIQQAA